MRDSIAATNPNGEPRIGVGTPVATSNSSTRLPDYASV